MSSLSATRYRSPPHTSRNNSRKKNLYIVSLLSQGFRNLAQQPVQSILIVILLSVLFFFTAALWLMYKNVYDSFHAWDNSPKIVMYLTAATTDDQAKNLLSKIQGQVDVAKAIYISPQQGLNQFIQQVGVNSLANNITDSSIPGVIEVLPANSLQTAEQVVELNESLQQLPMIASTHLNVDRVKAQFSQLNLWRSIAIISIFAGDVSILVAMIICMKMLLASENSVSKAKQYSQPLEGSFYTSGIYIGLVSAAIAAVLGLLFSMHSAVYLSQWLGVAALSMTFGLMSKLMGAGILLGLVSTWIALYMVKQAKA